MYIFHKSKYMCTFFIQVYNFHIRVYSICIISTKANTLYVWKTEKKTKKNWKSDSELWYEKQSVFVRSPYVHTLFFPSGLTSYIHPAKRVKCNTMQVYTFNLPITKNTCLLRVLKMLQTTHAFSLILYTSKRQ